MLTYHIITHNCTTLRSDRPSMSQTFLAVLVFVVGCIPYPHQQHRHPQIEGIVRRGGAPWANATVTLSVESSDNKSIPPQKTQTDSNGAFQLLPRKEWKLLMTLGDRRDVWRVCFFDDAASPACWEDRGFWGGPTNQTLLCEIGTPGFQVDCQVK